MKILVTGATGFIGAAFTRLALSQGHEVAGLVSPAKHPHLPATEKLTWLPGTLADAPWREIERFQPEVCLHLAWIATPGVYLESPENDDFLRWSVDFLRRVRTLGTNHIIGAGTCIEYQITNAPLSEKHTPIAPTTRYARCKNELRKVLEIEAQREGFTFCWGRVFYPYGPGEHPARLCTALIQKFRRGEKVVLKTPNSTKDYIYIDDLAAAILVTLERRFVGPINWGTGQGITVRQIADTVAALVGHPELVAEASPAVVDPLGFVVADAGRLRGMGWKPLTPLSRGVEKLLAGGC